MSTFAVQKNCTMKVLIATAFTFASFSIYAQKEEIFQVARSVNSDARIISGDTQNSYIYPYRQVGKIHERRFVFENQAYFFVRKYHGINSSLIVKNDKDEVLVEVQEINKVLHYHFFDGSMYRLYHEGPEDVYSVYHYDRKILTATLSDQSNVNVSVLENDPKINLLRLILLESVLSKPLQPGDTLRTDTRNR